jgi:F-type H+-transporting ATPase subunit delta
MATAAASRYARALADLVLAPSSRVEPQSVSAQLEQFERALSTSAELRQVLLSPAVPAARKRDLVSRLAAQLGASPLVRNFLCVVIGHRRVKLLPEILRAFQEVLDERSGIVRADVFSARDLDTDERASLAAQLARLTRGKVECRFALDPALMGGAVARIGSTVYDGSLRGQLESLRRKLAAEQEAGGRG